jgi:hypothetical protein
MRFARVLVPLFLCAVPAIGEAAYTSSLSSGEVTLTGDASADQLVITISDGFLVHNRSDVGFESSRDWDTSAAGEQTLAIAISITINCGAGADVITLGSEAVDASQLATGSIVLSENDAADLASVGIYLTQDSGLIYNVSATGLSATDLDILHPGTFGGGIVFWGHNSETQFRVDGTDTGEPIEVRRMANVYVGPIPSAVLSEVFVTNSAGLTDLTIDASSATGAINFGTEVQTITGLTAVPVRYVYAEVDQVELKTGSGADTFVPTQAANVIKVYLGAGDDRVTMTAGSYSGLEVYGEAGDDLFLMTGTSRRPVLIDGGSENSIGDRLTFNTQGGIWLERDGVVYSQNQQQYVQHSELELVDVRGGVHVREKYAVIPSGSCPPTSRDPYTGTLVVGQDEQVSYEITFTSRTTEAVFAGMRIDLSGREILAPTGTLAPLAEVIYSGCIAFDSGGELALTVGGTYDFFPVEVTAAAPFSIIKQPPPIEGWLLDGTGNLSRRSMSDPGTVLEAVTVTSASRLIAIDFRPATGDLYGLGVDGQLYLVNTSTGVATAIGDPHPALMPAQPYVGFDFDPISDQAVLTAGVFARLSPVTGAVVSSGAPAVFAPGDLYEGQIAFLSAIAYGPATNPSTSQLYGLATADPAFVTISFPGGVATATTDSYFPAEEPRAYGFDILSSGDGYAVEVDPAAPTATRFYRLDVSSSDVSIDYFGEIPETFVDIAFPVSPLPTFTVASKTFAEPDSGTTGAAVRLEFSETLAQPASVRVAISSGTATSGSDFPTYSPFTLDLPAGVDFFDINLLVNGDALYEETETFNVAFSQFFRLAGEPFSTSFQISNHPNDLAPTMSAGNLVVPETNSDTEFLLTVTLSAVSGAAASVTLTATDGTATAANDYIFTNQTITLPAGKLALDVPFTVRGDTVPENSESFLVTLSSASGATLSDDTASVIISDSDVVTPTPSPTPTPVPPNTLQALLDLEAPNATADQNNDLLIDAADLID